MDIKKEEALVVGIATVLFLAFIFLVRPSFIGFAVYTSLDYNYDNSLINLSDNEIKLVPVINTTTLSSIVETKLELLNATQDGKGKLDKVNALDGNTLTIDKNNQDEILNIFFQNNLNKDDIVSVYFTSNKATQVYICNESILCSEPYSNETYDGSNKWVNFTLSSLNNPQSSFGIFPLGEDVKVDYIYATHFETTTNTTTTLTYPFSASIETQDIVPANISNFDYVNYNQTLNNQKIDYFYSADSGNTWNNLSDNNISLLNLTKIRIKAVLNSDGTNTPVIDSLSLIYNEISQNISETNLSEEDNSSVPDNPSEGASSENIHENPQIVDRAPSSSVPRQELLRVEQIVPVEQEEQKTEKREIEITEKTNENIDEIKNKPEYPISGNLIKDLESKKIIGLYAFIGIIVFSYLIYHFKVKKHEF